VKKPSLPSRAILRRDLVAGIPGAVASVPDGMAASVLAGIGPSHGLYASFAGPAAGGLASSTRLMVITTTSAAALAAGSAVAEMPAEDRGGGVVLVTLIAGLVMLTAGLLKMGRFARFVSHSVMSGFLFGIAVNILLGQVPDLTGAEATGKTSLAKAISVITHPSRIDGPSLAVGLLAIVVLVVAMRTPVASYGAVLALVVPTVAALLLGLDVESVGDTGEIPAGLPIPALPTFGLLSVGIVLGGLSVAAIVLVQGYGVSQSVPNSDGRPSSASQDFTAQGVGNLASAVFAGQPVGGSVGQTAMNVAAGAASRWAGIFSGLWMLAILVALSPVVSKALLPTLAAILMVAAVGSLRPRALLDIIRANKTSAIAALTTLIATLLLPVAAAVGIGVALSLLLQVNQEAMDLRVVQLLPVDGGLRTLADRPTLRSHEVSIFDVYGSVLYAGSRTLQALLPDPRDVVRPAVVLRLRGRAAVGATVMVVLADYADRLGAVDGRLYLSGLTPNLAARLRADPILAGHGIRFFQAEPRLTDSTGEAYAEAQAWVSRG
jgi:SulP family sulfate permease